MLPVIAAKPLFLASAKNTVTPLKYSDSSMRSGCPEARAFINWGEFTVTFNHSRVSAKTFALSTLTLAIATSGLAMPVLAEKSAADLETIIVVGQTGSLNKSLREQRMSKSIRSVVHADGIAQLPDDNPAEAVQRLPGVSVQRDQGEGRFVSVRGLGPDFNAVTVNGTLMPAPENDRRAVALDVLPSELVQSLSVVKSLTPDMDANSLGGTVAVESLSAFDHDGLFYSVSAEGSHDDNTGKNSPKVSGALSQRFGMGDGSDNAGIALAVSWQKRDFGSDNVETGGAWDFEDGEKLEEMELRDYAISRERMGLGFNFDYKPTETSLVYIRTLYSRYTDDEVRQGAVVEYEDPLAVGEMGVAETARELKAREEAQEVKSLVLGGEQELGNWLAQVQMGYSRSSEKSPGGIAGAVFEAEDAFEDVYYSNARKPQLHIDSAFYDAGNFFLKEVEWEKQNTRDTEYNINVDLLRDYTLSSYSGQLKFGGKISRRTKENDTSIWIFEDFDDSGFSDESLSLTQFNGKPVDYKFGQFGPSIRVNPVQALIHTMEWDDYYDTDESRINDFSLDEDINAAYLMNTVDIGNLNIIAGVRYEGTDLFADGTGMRDGVYEVIQSEVDYDHWLPGLHFLYQWGESTQLRAAWTNSVVRPTFGQLAPGYLIETEDGEASFGNPDLKPLESSNLDVGIEYYMGDLGVISLFGFYKDIENFTYAINLAGTGEWADFDEAHTYGNGDDASLYGVEFAYSQKLDMLPGLWSNLLLGANVTVSRSKADVTDFIDGEAWTRRIDLPNQSDKVGNLMLGWENDALSLRLSANYKSSFLDELSSIDDPEHDLFADAQTFLDFTARYNINNQLQVYFEAQNLTNEAYYIYTGRKGLNAQYEEYGSSFRLGVTFTHF